MAGASNNASDILCDISEYHFSYDFRIENFNQCFNKTDGVASKPQTFVSGNVVLQILVKRNDNQDAAQDANQMNQWGEIVRQNGNPFAVIQLCGLIRKGRICVADVKMEPMNLPNLFRPQHQSVGRSVTSIGNISHVCKKLESEKEPYFQIIAELQYDVNKQQLVQYGFYDGIDGISKHFRRTGRGQMSDSTLTVKVSGTILTPFVNKEEIATVEELRKTGLPQELSSLLQTPKYSDIDISVGGKNFSVHKNILWSTSKGFAQILQEMESKNGNNPVNILTVTGFSPEVVQEALKYMYTGTVPNIKSLASDLLVFSAKYKISGLKILCESEIELSIATGNACEYADLADRLNAVQLRSYCVDFIKKNVKLIVGTEKWKQFRRKNPDLAADIVESLVVG